MLSAVENFEETSKQFRSLTNLLTTLGFLADIYMNLTYSHGKIATTLLTALAAPVEAQTLVDIGEVYRFCLAETILIKKPRSSAAEPATIETEVTMSDGTATPSAKPVNAVDAPAKSPAPQTPNQKAVLDVVSQIPTNIVPLLQGAPPASRKPARMLTRAHYQPPSSCSFTAAAPTRSTARRPRQSLTRSRRS